ncbi:ras-related protein Rab-36-like [Xiphophorus couchianus]|uniref:ras-related protein Rab-36-like n=1 Tax=Xiphophorus couchianus TaxID=32473 RepID=UPI00101680BD|nr:ras-related protein Rab-36-like [Xiphophorus couchianus]XP_027875265.1 ras-related protein Rab-36-like [Xiphophorus couchianus]
MQRAVIRGDPRKQRFHLNHLGAIMQDHRNGMKPFPPPVSNDRIISEFPQCYTPEASFQLKTDWDIQTKAAFKHQAARLQTWDRQKMSKVVVVGDLNVGKTALIKRFCKDVFERDYKATIGVDFEIERFQILGVPFSLQIWDTAGQEKFKCIVSTYYRGAQVIVTVFDMADIQSLNHARQWLEEAMRENYPNSCFIFLVGTKTDLLPSDERERTEKDAVHIAAEMHAEFWTLSAKTGENVQAFFFRVAGLTFENCIMKDMEKGVPASIGCGNAIKSDRITLAEGTYPKKNIIGPTVTGTPLWSQACRWSTLASPWWPGLNAWTSARDSLKRKRGPPFPPPPVGGAKGVRGSVGWVMAKG